MSGATYWLAFDIGCIECGQESRALGLHLTKQAAEAVCESARIEQEADWHGQHSFEVFEVQAP
ncbi:hypothetical protein [Panacagrimonas sp.]|uniref:hypothetical protein n=1 Tax=Panacagrimonas sp. TaxID=2480088 RepID=UPI003B52A403